jgi:hypothetical protein
MSTTKSLGGWEFCGVDLHFTQGNIFLTLLPVFAPPCHLPPQYHSISIVFPLASHPRLLYRYSGY